jgi:hypothetical protein
VKAVWYMVLGSVASWLIVGLGAARHAAVEILLGMLAPLAITATTLVLVERAIERDPRNVTQMMIKAFLSKMVLVGAYVAAVLGVLSVQPTAFIISFTAYFLVLYFFEFLCLRRVMGVSG